jgi:hypothetical protein
MPLSATGARSVASAEALFAPLTPSPPSDVREHAVERARCTAEIERLHKRRCESNFPVGEEAAELLLSRPCSMRGLLLVGAKRSQLPMRGEDLLHHTGTEATDQLVLQIRLAHIEAEPLHVGAAEVATEAGALESEPQRALLSRVAETGQPDIRATRTVQIQEPADCLRAPNRHDGNTLGRENPATSQSKRHQRDLVTDALNKHDCARVHDPGSLTTERRLRPRLPESPSPREAGEFT